MEIISKYPVMIFKNDYGKYFCGISKKNMDGSYDNAYFQVVFNRKDAHLENKTKIEIKNAWLDFYNYVYEGKEGREKRTKWYIRISQFDILKNEEENDIIEKQEDKDLWEEFAEEHDDLELPF